MGNLTDDIEQRLKEGGWELVRRGKHRIWRHPNGATHAVSTTLRDVGVDRVRSFREISHKERDPKRCTRNPYVQESTTVPPKHLPITLPKILERPPVMSTARVKKVPWFESMRQVRESSRIQRNDLAARMSPYYWSGSTVRALETGKLSITEDEFRQWKVVLGVEDNMVVAAIEVPFAPKDDPKAIQRQSPPQPPPAPKIVVKHADPKPTVSLAQKPWHEMVESHRKAQGLLQNEAAALVGITPSRYNRIEKGKALFTQAEFRRWCEVMKVPDKGIPGLDVPFRSVPEQVIPPKKVAPDTAPAASTPEPPTIPATPVTDSPLGLTREWAIQGLVKCLSNPRLTDAEVVKICTDSTDTALRLLLGPEVIDRLLERI